MVEKSDNIIFPCHHVAICSSIWMDMYFYKRWYDRTDVFIGQLHGISILHFTRCNMCLLFQQYQMKKLKRQAEFSRTKTKPQKEL